MEPKAIKNILLRRGYELMEKIGQGGSANCYRIFSKKYQKTFVLKLSQQQKTYNEELKAYKSLFHPNIILCFDAFVENSYFFLILEDCTEHGTLDDIIKNSGQLSTKTVIQYSKQIAAGLQFMHSHNLAHLDIKPSNILIDQYGRLKICDFGIAYNCTGKEKCTQFLGTRIFMSPEMLRKKPFDPMKADVWAFGVTLYYMICGKCPWNSIKDQDNLIMQGTYSLNRKVDADIFNMVKSCMCVDPENRIGIEEIYKFFEEKNKEYMKVTELPKLVVNKNRLVRQNTDTEKNYPRPFISSRIDSGCKKISVSYTSRTTKPIARVRSTNSDGRKDNVFCVLKI